MNEEKRVGLQDLRCLLVTIGSANDAEDRGYLEEAKDMRRRACESIESLMVEYEYLSELFPGLCMEMQSGHILGFGWSSLCDALDGYSKEQM